MKWKSGVIVERKKNEIQFSNREEISAQPQKKTVAKEDYYIVDAIEQGITDDKELIQLVCDAEQVNDVVAGFRLAQFVVDYGYYISNDVGHMIIEP